MKKAGEAAKKGNALSEYAILGALVAFACVATLNLLGRSMSELLGGVATAQTGEQMNRLVHLDFRNEGAALRVGNPLAVSETPEALRLTESTGAGANASSTEGNVVRVAGAPPSVNEALTVAQRFDALASAANKVEVANLYRKIADTSYVLASTQASYEVNANGKNAQPLQHLAETMNKTLPGGALSRMNTLLKGIDDGMLALGQGKSLILNNTLLAPAEKQEALLMIDAAIAASQGQYGNTMRSNSVYQLSVSIKPPEGEAMTQLRAVAVSVATDASLRSAPAVDGSVQAGTHLDGKAQSR